jgi:hypothetical protein|tara:strand:+ start:1093 stop:1521 length:429 start_codon:yes stop_codon:yes gene_type:complete
MADLKDKIIKLDEYLGKQRIEWTDKIKALTEDLKLGNNLEQVSSYSLSYRQILVESLTSMSIRMRAQKSSVDQKYKTKWIEYYNYDYKLTDKQREKFLLADLAEDNQLLDLLESQKSFFEATVKTLDNMGFAIKNRLDMSRI